MAKHETRISRKKYILNMFLAILISLIGGIATGFFTAKYYVSKNNVKPPSVVQTQPDNKVPEQNPIVELQTKKLTKDEQVNVVKATLKSYYDINNAVMTKTLDDSKKESKNTGKSLDTLFKDNLYKYYEQVAAKDFLSTMKGFIYSGNLNAKYYADFFKSQEGSQVKSVEITQYKDKENLIEAKVVTSMPYKFLSTGADKIPTSTEFFSYDNGKGITSQQYAKLLSLNPSRVNVIQTYNGNIIIEMIDQKWYITSYNNSLSSTEIKDIVVANKTMTLTEFINKYFKSS